MNFAEQRASADMLAVVQSAGLLGISEFRLFQIAYETWYGRETDEHTMESYFASYLFQETVPFWVRHFTRQISGLENEGRLNPEDFGIKQQQATRQEIIRGRWHATWMMLTLSVLLLLIGFQSV